MTLWGGRFSSRLNEQAWELNTSLPVDQRMAIQDVDGSLAWAEAIHRAGILSAEEYASVSAGLTTIRDEFLSGQFSFAPSDQDIHTAVERRLSELIGEAADPTSPSRSCRGRRRPDRPRLATDPSTVAQWKKAPPRSLLHVVTEGGLTRQSG